MMEQFKGCSSRSIKAGKKGTGDLSSCYLFLCSSFLSKLMRLVSHHHLKLTTVYVCVMPFASAALTLLVCSPFLHSIWVTCCQGREFHNFL